MHATQPRIPILLLALAVLAAGASAQAPRGAAQATGAKATMDKGVELFGQERYREALDLFGKVIADPKAHA